MAALVGVFLLSQLVFPKTPDIMFFSGLQDDQLLAPIILTALKEEGFWRLFWGGQLPCARGAYHSVLMAYLYLPFYVLFGPNLWMAKFWHLFFAVPTLLFTYFLAKGMYSKRAAFLTLFLLVIHTHYIAGMRVGGLVLSSMQFFSTGALFFLLRWWLTGRSLFFCLGLFFAGLGMCTQLWFYWFVVGLIVVAWLYRKEIIKRCRETTMLLQWASLGTASFLSGAALIVYREVFYPLQSLSAVFGRLEGTEGTYIKRLWETFSTSLSHFRSEIGECSVKRAAIFLTVWRELSRLDFPTTCRGMVFLPSFFGRPCLTYS